MPCDKQLKGISLETVIKKRELDQALNAKEFAVLSGVSYSKARGWMNLPGFPALGGVVFWKDFEKWRCANQSGEQEMVAAHPQIKRSSALSDLPAKARKILQDN